MDRSKEIELEPLLTVEETAAALRVCTRTVRRAIKSGELPAVRLGRQYRIRRRDLEWFLRQRCSG
jgi:excisionase family DNA binding protein